MQPLGLSSPSALSFFLFLAGLLTTTLAAANVSSSSYTIDGDTGNTFTVALNVPSPNQNDDLYFHVSAPGEQAWVAFGFGTGMSGALIFVIYESADGKNVTVSPRLGTGHTMPTYTSDVKIDILAGSGVIDGNYVVNAKCTGCRSWSGGKSIDITSTAQPMIWAVADGTPIQTNSQQSILYQHSNQGLFDLNLVQATGPAGIPSGDAGGSSGDSLGPENHNIPRAVHAVLMVGAFLIGFPAGYLFLRVFERVWIHWTVQSIAAFAVLVGMAGGIALSKKQDISPNLTAPHQIVGFIVVALVLGSWTVGLLGHRLYRKTGIPAIPMKVHKILGPATVFLGLVNCAVGFHFAGETHGIIGFVVLTLLMVLVVTSLVFFTRRRRSRRAAMNTPAAQNFRAGQMEGQYAGPPGPSQQEDGVLLQPYAAPAGRPQPSSLPSYHSDGGYDSEGRGQGNGQLPPRV